jgi:hypothetical protein
MADLVDSRTQHRLPGVEPGLLHGSLREGGFGLLPVPEHVYACHAKWLCRTLRALLQAATADISRDPAKIILPDATDLPGGVGPPRQRPDPMWLLLAANALKVCNPSVPPLQILLCAAYSTPTYRALGWVTDVEGQTYLLPCGFLQLLAGAAGALGGMQQQVRQPPTTPLLCSTRMQSAPCSSSAPCLVHSWSLLARGLSGVDTMWASPIPVGMWQFANITASQGFARYSWRVLALPGGNDTPNSCSRPSVVKP